MQRRTSGKDERRFTRNRLSRGRGLRKTTGCLTCRRRHVRCDEARPRCKACTRIGSDCTWPHSTQESGGSHFPAGGTDFGNKEGLPLETDISIDPQIVASTSNHNLTSPVNDTSDNHVLRTESGWPQADDEAAATLVEIRDGWQDDLPIDASRHDHEAECRGRHESQQGPSPSDTAPSFDVVSTTSISSALHTFGPSSGPSPFGHNVFDWVQPDARTFHDVNVEEAARIWANLLLKDASTRTEPAVSGAPFSPAITQLSPPEHSSMTVNDLSVVTSLSSRPEPIEQDQISEDKAWQSSVPLKLKPNEYPLFQDFIQNLSLWMDFFDPKRPFGTLVPHLAMRNRGLMNAILALSIRHLSLNVRFQPQNARPQDPLDALPFYFTTLHYIREAMQYDSYKNSIELLATASIVSAYEMLDNSRQDWERHLRGLSCIQQSQGIHGDSGGLKQAVWWTWLCQDVWAAWREKRKPFMTWKPDRSLLQLDNYELAARSVYLFGQTTGFCSKEEIESGRNDPNARLAKSRVLRKALNEWRDHLPDEFSPLPVSGESGANSPFQPIWIHPPCFAIAVQLFHCSQILISANTPLLGGMDEYKRQRAELDEHVLAICGIASVLKSDPASVMCSQALHIAGSFVQEQAQRKAVIEMLDGCWRRAGWPLQSLGVELQEEWDSQGTR